MGTTTLTALEYDDAFSSCWKEVKKEFFKCEALQEYNEESEQELLSLFNSGNLVELRRLLQEDVDHPGSIWNGAKTRGITFRRVHLYQVPLTQYLRFELEAYVIQAAKGEDIRMALIDQLNSVGGWNIRDFMLFDNATALIPDYDSNNILTGATLSREPKVLDELLTLRDVLMELATPLEEFLSIAKV